MTSPACSGTVTRPPRVACLSWAWEPLWTTITQPSRPRACTTCRPVMRGRGGIEGIVRGRCDHRAHSHALVARPTVRPIWVDELTTATHTEALSLSAKKPTFEPTNPSQSVARSCTPLQTTRGTAFWTSQNATMRDDPTRPATLLSYLRIRRLGIQGDRLQLRTTQPGRHSPGPTGHLSWRSNRPTRVDQTVRRPAPRAHAAREYAAYRLPVLTGGCPPPA